MKCDITFIVGDVYTCPQWSEAAQLPKKSGFRAPPTASFITKSRLLTVTDRVGGHSRSSMTAPAVRVPVCYLSALPNRVQIAQQLALAPSRMQSDSVTAALIGRSIEQLFQQQRAIRHDRVHSQFDHAQHVFAAVDGPYLNCQIGIV